MDKSHQIQKDKESKEAVILKSLKRDVKSNSVDFKMNRKSSLKNN